jgi:hypothetical protein
MDPGTFTSTHQPMEKLTTRQPCQVVVFNPLNPVKGAPSMRFSSANFLLHAKVTRFNLNILTGRKRSIGLKKNLWWFSKA